MTTQPTKTADEILMGGGGPPAAKFEAPGTTIGGRIVAKPIAYQEREYDPNRPGAGDPKFFPSGDPIMGINVDVATSLCDNPDDTGVRRLYVQGKRFKEAVRDAVRAAGGNGLEVGGELTVTFTHREDPTDKRSAKFYDVTYVPAANAALMADTPQQAATAAAAPPATATATGDGAVDQATLEAAMSNLSPEVIAAIKASKG